MGTVGRLFRTTTAIIQIFENVLKKKTKIFRDAKIFTEYFWLVKFMSLENVFP